MELRGIEIPETVLEWNVPEDTFYKARRLSLRALETWYLLAKTIHNNPQSVSKLGNELDLTTSNIYRIINRKKFSSLYKMLYDSPVPSLRKSRQPTIRELLAQLEARLTYLESLPK